MIHCYRPKGSKYILHGSVRLQDPSHRSIFLFLSRHLWSLTKSLPAFKNLRRIPLMSPPINESLVKVIKIYAKTVIKIFWICPILPNFFFQMYISQEIVRKFLSLLINHCSLLLVSIFSNFQQLKILSQSFNKN